MDNWEKSGKIAAEARAYGLKLMKEGALILEIAEKIEKKIVELGGKPAFPVDVSINHMAAHACPFKDETTTLKKGDVVKLDMGVSVEGCVTDTARTVEIETDNYKELIKASEEALNEAIKIIKPGVKVREIGKVIQDKIQSYGFSPIRNLSGHGLGEYQVHTGLTIPNYDNGDERVLSKGMKVAIEPFATTGEGKVIEGKPSGVFGLIGKKPIRNVNARKVLSFIEKEYKTLPFAARCLDFPNINFILRILEKEGVIKQYTQLPEKGRGIVSQAEDSIVVDDPVKVLTKI